MNQSELEYLRAELEKTKYEFKKAQLKIAAMETSKFWQLRSQWFKIREALGINNENDSLSLLVVFEFILSKFKKLSKETIRQTVWSENAPLVSVIIPCFNYGQYLEEAIDSVLSQTWQDVEIIVVDDGSTDFYTQEVLAKINKPKTKIIRQSNQKLPAARNNGIKIARGKYICCLDADDKLEPTFLEKCLIKLETENLDICYSWSREFGYSDSIIRANDFKIEQIINCNCCIVAVVKKSIWQQVNGFTETMIYGYEDWEFYLKVAKAGAIGGKIDEPLFLYRKHGESMLDEAQKKHQMLCQIIRDNHPDLYRNQALIKQVIKSRQEYLVIDGYINLERRIINNIPPCSSNLLFFLEKITKTILEKITAWQKQNCHLTIVTTEISSKEYGENYQIFSYDFHELPKIFINTTAKANTTNQDKKRWQEYLNYLIESRKIDRIFCSQSNYEFLSYLEAKFSLLECFTD